MCIGNGTNGCNSVKGFTLLVIFERRGLVFLWDESPGSPSSNYYVIFYPSVSSKDFPNMTSGVNPSFLKILCDSSCIAWMSTFRP